MTEIGHNVVSFIVITPEGVYDPVKKASEREVRILNDFGLKPSDFELPRRRRLRSNIIKFPRRINHPTTPRSA